MNEWREIFLAKENKGKGPEVRVCLAYSKINKKASVVGEKANKMKSEKRLERGGGKGWSGAQNMQSLIGHGSVSIFIPSDQWSNWMVWSKEVTWSDLCLKKVTLAAIWRKTHKDGSKILLQYSRLNQTVAMGPQRKYYVAGYMSLECREDGQVGYIYVGWKRSPR